MNARRLLFCAQRFGVRCVFAPLFSGGVFWSAVEMNRESLKSGAVTRRTPKRLRRENL